MNKANGGETAVQERPARIDWRRANLDGVYTSDGTIACDNHLSLRVLALRRARMAGMRHKDAGEEMYPASIGHMLSHGPIWMYSLWRDVGDQGRKSYPVDCAEWAAQIRDWASRDQIAPHRRSALVLAERLSVMTEITVTIGLSDTGSYPCAMLPESVSTEGLWFGARVPAGWIEGWLDRLLDRWLDEQGSDHAESPAARAALDEHIAAGQAAADEPASGQARARALRGAAADAPEIGIALHGAGLGDPACEYGTIVRRPQDDCIIIDGAADRDAAILGRGRGDLLDLVERHGGYSRDRSTIVVVRGSVGNGCRYDHVYYLAATTSDYWRTPGVGACTRHYVGPGKLGPIHAR